MEKDIGRIAKNSGTDILVRIDDFGGRAGVTIREFVNESPSGYKGFTKAGTRIPVDKFLEFRELINSINLEELKKAEAEAANSKTTKKASAPNSNASVEDY
jgi:hypothetical protein